MRALQSGTATVNLASQKALLFPWAGRGGPPPHYGTLGRWTMGGTFGIFFE